MSVSRFLHPPALGGTPSELQATGITDDDWQTFVRYSWARGHFWTQESSVYPKLGINDAAIWQRVDDPVNRQEIQHFTGEDPTTVACNP